MLRNVNLQLGMFDHAQKRCGFLSGSLSFNSHKDFTWKLGEECLIMLRNVVGFCLAA